MTHSHSVGEVLHEGATLSTAPRTPSRAEPPPSKGAEGSVEHEAGGSQRRGRAGERYAGRMGEKAQHPSTRSTRRSQPVI